MTKLPKAPALTIERRRQQQAALLMRERADDVYDALIEVLQETPEALSPDYADDFLCDLMRMHIPDVTAEEIVSALRVLSARSVALRELMQSRK